MDSPFVFPTQRTQPAKAALFAAGNFSPSLDGEILLALPSFLSYYRARPLGLTPRTLPKSQRIDPGLEFFLPKTHVDSDSGKSIEVCPNWDGVPQAVFARYFYLSCEQKELQQECLMSPSHEQDTQTSQNNLM